MACVPLTLASTFTIAGAPVVPVPPKGGSRSTRRRRPAYTYGVADRARPAGRLDAAVDAELVVDVADVRADGLLADEQPRRDLAVREPFGEQVEHVGLAPGQELVGGAVLRRRCRQRRDAGAPGERVDVLEQRPGAELDGRRVGGGQALGRGAPVAAAGEQRLRLAQARVGGRVRLREGVEAVGRRAPQRAASARPRRARARRARAPGWRARRRRRRGTRRAARRRARGRPRAGARVRPRRRRPPRGCRATAARGCRAARAGP